MVTFDFRIFSIGALCEAGALFFDTAINQFLQFFGLPPASFAAQICVLIDVSDAIPI